MLGSVRVVVRICTSFEHRFLNQLAPLQDMVELPIGTQQRSRRDYPSIVYKKNLKLVLSKSQSRFWYDEGIRSCVADCRENSAGKRQSVYRRNTQHFEHPCLLTAIMGSVFVSWTNPTDVFVEISHVKWNVKLS